jgi:hypothetical protein
MVFSRTNPEDIDVSCEEHAVKAAMYALTRHRVSGGMVKVHWAH